MVPLFAPALISRAVPCLTDASDQEITERTVEGEDGGWVETEVAGGELFSSKLSSIHSLPGPCRGFPFLLWSIVVP